MLPIERQPGPWFEAELLGRAFDEPRRPTAGQVRRATCRLLEGPFPLVEPRLDLGRCRFQIVARLLAFGMPSSGCQMVPGPVDGSRVDTEGRQHQQIRTGLERQENHFVADSLDTGPTTGKALAETFLEGGLLQGLGLKLLVANAGRKHKQQRKKKGSKS